MKTSRRLVLAAAVGIVAAPAGAQPVRPPIAQPSDRTPAAFMAWAQVLRDRAVAAGDQGFGAVVVRDGAIVGEGPSRVVTNDDPTAHAEMEAIRDAAARIGRRGLAGAVLYSTFRPCPMCAAAAYWAGLVRLYHGAGIVDGGPPGLPSC